MGSHAGRSSRSLRRGPRGALAVHLFGALALLASLFLPLTAQAAPAANDPAALTRAQSSDVGPVPEPEQVAVIGDFQLGLGCAGDFDPSCEQSQLTENEGRWSGTFAISPGTYNYQIVATGIDGQQRVYGDGGLDGSPLTVDVGDDQTGVYFAFDPRTDDITAEPVGNLYQLSTDDGQQLLVPDGDQLTGVVVAPGGDFSYEFVLNGESLGSQTVSLDPGRYRLVFDQEGNLLDSERLPEGTLTITRADGATGACYQLRRDGDVVNQACDIDDGDDGSTAMSFPDGLEPGGYTLSETTTPDGAATAADTDVELVEGDNSVEIPAGDGGDDGGDGDGDETPSIDPLGEEESPEATDESTETSTEEAGGEPGDLIVTLQTEDSQPVGGACFELVGDDGQVVEESCDTAEFGDSNPGNGNTGFFGVPSGTYTLRLSQAPEGIASVDEREVTIEAGGETAEVVTGTAGDAESPEATADATGDATDEATDTATEGTGDVVVLRQDDAGNPVGGACFEIVTADGTTVAEEVCDEDGDVADDGRIGFFDVPVGSWTLRETRTPSNAEPAAEQPIEIVPDVETDLVVQSALIETETETATETDTETETASPEATETAEAETGDLIVTLQTEDGQAVGGACFELLDENGEVVEESCDTAESGDSNPGNGNTGFFDVPTGTYTLRLSEAPDGVQTPEDQPVEIAATDDEPNTAIVTVSADATTETDTDTETETETETAPPSPDDDTGSVVVEFAQLAAVDANVPVCVELNTGGGIGLTEPPRACDNGDGDAADEAGLIRLDSVPAGDYTLSVTDGPAGATDTPPQPITVTAGQETTVTLGSPAPAETPVPTETPQPTQTPTPEGPQSGTLTIAVEDPDGEPVAETCFDVTNEAGTFGFCDEDGDGTLVVEDVVFGEQTVEQTEAPEGFELAAAETVAVTAEQPEAELVVTNEVGAGILPVVAVDAEGTGLPGACFVLTSTENAETTFGPLCDDGNNGGIASDGFVTFEQVPPGDYTITEDTPPDGYQQAGETDVTIQSGENEPVRIAHEPAAATVRVTTTSSDGETLIGGCYTIDGGDEVCDIDGDGILNIEGIVPGEHTLDQTTPPEGFQEAEDTIFTVEAGQSLVEVTVVNQATTGTVAVVIEDEAEEPLGESCATLDGGEEVCDDAANDAFPDESGRIGFAEVTAGEHTVALSEVPDDFEAPAEDETVNVVAEETAEATFTLAGAQPETGTLELTVQRTGDATEVVEGACVTLSSGGDAVEYCDGGQGDTDGAANGVILAVDVAADTYTVELTDASADAIEGFQNAESLNLTITAGGTTTDTLDVTVVLQPTTGVIEVVSRDAASPQVLLDGACYELRGVGDPIALCDDGDNDEDGTDGVILRSGIPAGTYTLVQTQTPETYQTAADVPDVVVTPPGTTTVNVDHQQKEQPGTLVVEKVDGTGQLLPGACFEVRQGNTLVADECEGDDGDGVFSFELMAGDYRLRETRPPSDDYRVAGSRIVSVSAGEETRVQVVNRPRAGRVEITSVDAADPDSRLENACFELRGERTYGSYCDDDDLNVDGRVLFENVAPGDYTIVETAAPDGFQRVADRTITVGPGGFFQITIQHEATPPPPEQGRLIVYKQDGQQQELPGGCFRLYDGDTPVSAETCDNDDGVNDATTIIDGAPVGTYTLRETLAPSPAYQIGEPAEVTIENGGTTEVTVVNQLKRGRILIRKTNEHGQALQNACFDLAQDEGGERCTDSHGRVAFDTLAPGEYDVTETRAPYGYEAVAPQEDVAVEPGRTTVLDLVDPIAEPDPDTGSVQVQKFVCPAGEQGERTVFFGGNEGNERLKNTAGCRKGNAEFTLTGGDGSGPGGFATGDDGQYQVTLPAGDYNLVETAPDLPGASETGVRVVPNKLTTVIVINFIAPPAPAAATINAVKYTCPAGFEGTLYDDFAQGCATNDRLTNHITIRANGPDQARGVTGDDGQRGQTTLDELTPGHYQVFEERPYTIPTAYGFCGYDPENPIDFKTVNGQISVSLEAGAVLTCAFFNIPEELTDTSGTILVRKYVCDVNDPPANYDWYEECRLSDEGARFELNSYVVEGDRYEPYTTGTANADGLLRFPRLQPGTYQLKELDSNWCHAESNSVNPKGDVVVSANKISDVFIFNCVDTKSPPNTGAGPNAGPEELPGSDGIVPSLAWPVALLAAWGWHRRRTSVANAA